MGNVKRQQRLRRRLLELVEAEKSRGDAGLRGRFAADVMEDLPDSIEGDDELIGLARDLAHLALLEINDTRTLKAQRPGLDYMVFRITAKGTQLLAGLVPVEPLVEDERIS
jgi:hypothetical protein